MISVNSAGVLGGWYRTLTHADSWNNEVQFYCQVLWMSSLFESVSGNSPDPIPDMC